MTLDELLTTCAESSPDDWNTITTWGARSGPSYLDQFVPGMTRTEGGEQEFRLQHREHSQRAAYTPDLSINVGWGLDPDNLFPDEERELAPVFPNDFPDSDWSFNYCDFFYNGNLVERVPYGVVDGGRSVLPLPDNDGNVTQWQHDWFRVLDGIGLYVSDYDNYFERSGLKIK
jgi:hypothetical protein